MSSTDDAVNAYNGARELSYLQLFLALLAPLTVLAITVYLKLDLANRLVISVTRTIINLTLAGGILLGFIFSLESPFLVIGYLFLMSLIAAVEVTARQHRTYKGHYLNSLVGVILGGGVIGTYATLVVFTPKPWWNPRVMVPTVGMIIGNSISGPSLAVDRLLSEVVEKSHEPEVRLAFGASRDEAVRPTVQTALKAALMPTLNAMAVVGIVSIPGMMTGQLLGGSSPLVAAEYQMAILWLIFGTSFLSTFTAITLATRSAVFDSQHRLTVKRIVKTHRTELDVWLWRSIQAAGRVLSLSIQSLRQLSACCCSSNSSCSNDSSHYSSLSSGTDSVSKSSLRTSMSMSTDRISMSDSSAHLLEPMVSRSPSLPSSGSGSDTGSDPSSVEYRATYTVARSSGAPQVKAEPLLIISKFNVCSGSGRLFADGLSLTVHAGEIVSLEGPSGLGKTRLLRGLSQLDTPLSGTSNFIDQPLSPGVSAASWMGPSSSAGTGPSWRRRCLYVPQALPPLSGSPEQFIRECCGYACRAGSRGATSLLNNLEAQLQIVEMRVGLREGKLKQTWAELSGGERQRAIIVCGILITSTYKESSREDDLEFGSAGGADCGCVLLLDEPTAACDPDTTLMVERALRSADCAIIMITHDESQALRLAHTRILLTPTESFVNVNIDDIP